MGDDPSDFMRSGRSSVSILDVCECAPHGEGGREARIWLMLTESLQGKQHIYQADIKD